MDASRPGFRLCPDYHHDLLFPLHGLPPGSLLAGDGVEIRPVAALFRQAAGGGVTEWLRVDEELVLQSAVSSQQSAVGSSP